jgi:hypothetical protein
MLSSYHKLNKPQMNANQEKKQAANERKWVQINQIQKAQQRHQPLRKVGTQEKKRRGRK